MGGKDGIEMQVVVFEVGDDVCSQSFVRPISSTLAAIYQPANTIRKNDQDALAMAAVKHPYFKMMAGKGVFPGLAWVHYSCFIWQDLIIHVVSI